MSIAEKNTIISANNVTIAENEQKVYKAGQLKTLQDSEYMNAKVSGTAITVNDVSPIEHSVGCKLARKNLCSNKYTDYADTSYKSLYAANAPLIMSFKDKDTSVDVSGCYIGFCVNPNNVSSEGYRWIVDNGILKSTKTNNAVTNGALCPYIIFFPQAQEVFNKLMQRWDIQVEEKGTTATEYTPYVEELDGIEVSRYGKNLALAEDVYKGNFMYDVVEFEGRTAVTFIDSSGAQWSGISFKPNTQYTVSFDARVAERDSVVTTENSGLFCFTYSDGQKSWIISKRNTEWEHFTLTSVAGKTVVSIGIASYNYRNKNYIDCNSFQLEEGSTATAYEPYNRTTYQSTADGTVDGITSISPNMTLLTNNNGVVINANYLRDIDTYIDNLITDVALSGGEA